MLCINVNFITFKSLQVAPKMLVTLHADMKWCLISFNEENLLIIQVDQHGLVAGHIITC